jgi:hypothetical protein
MPWRVEMEPQRRIILVAYESRVSTAEIHACVARVIELMRSEKASKVLMELDGAAQIEATTVEIVNLPAMYQALGLPGPFRQAIVVSPQAPAFDQAAFYETVCTNRGHAVRIFPDRGRALDWLDATA